ncbi:MAG: methionine--tRNA ligase [Patescibacteria group bacterium]
MSKFYQTTSIAYVNGAPHLGFALELIQADAVARWHRQKGDEVFFLTGTDEHGAKIVRAAEEAGIMVKDFIDQNAEKFRALKEILNLSWDDFIRTSDQEKHWPNVVELWKKLEQAGDIYKKNYKGLYCVGHEAFVTEKDLINGVCRDHNKKPEIIEEENYFFRLIKYGAQIKALIESNQIRIIPETRAHEIISFIDRGLEDISFSRPRKDLQWGISVPGDDSQTIYVWADALANYLYPIRQRADLWPADIHFIGKDILRFHALFWPAMLLSANLPLPRSIFVHGHITVEGQKMSKTLGNVIDPVELVKKYGVDAARYYLLREITPTDDGDFSYKKFEERYNGDLANGLGNFAARALTLAEKENVNFSENKIDETIINQINKTKRIIDEKMEEYKFHEALAALWELISFGDRYLNEKKPWSLESAPAEGEARQGQQDKEKIISDCIFILKNIAELLTPFLPETSEKILKNIQENKKGEVLFSRI